MVKLSGVLNGDYPVLSLNCVSVVVNRISVVFRAGVRVIQLQKQ